jgi:hypothetical protein
MSNGFEALAPYAADIKQKARDKAAQDEKEQKARQKIASETEQFLRTMRKTGVKSASSLRLSSSLDEKDIDFSKAMKMAGVEPLGEDKRVRHAKKTAAPVPSQTIADNRQVLEDSLSDELDSVEFLESEDGLAVGRGLEGCFALEDDFLCLRVEDFEEGASAEGSVGEVLDGGANAALVIGAQEAGQIEASHQFFAGYGLCLDIGGEKVVGVGHTQQLPGGQAFGEREGEGDFACGGVAVETGEKGRGFIEVRAQRSGSGREGRLAICGNRACCFLGFWFLDVQPSDAALQVFVLCEIICCGSPCHHQGGCNTILFYYTICSAGFHHSQTESAMAEGEPVGPSLVEDVECEACRAVVFHGKVELL